MNHSENTPVNEGFSSHITSTSLLTVDEVAKYLRITPTTVRKLAANGHLPAFKIGRAWRFLRSEIEKLNKR